MSLIFFSEKCSACAACVEACPFGVLSLEGETLAIGEGCNLCGACVEVCEVAALAVPEGAGPGRRAAGAHQVYLTEPPSLKDFLEEPYAAALTELARKFQPEIILAGATYLGRAFIPRVAAALKTGLTADCTAFAIDPEPRLLLQTRPAFGGNIMATIITPRTYPQMATPRPGVFKPRSVAAAP